MVYPGRCRGGIYTGYIPHHGTRRDTRHIPTMVPGGIPGIYHPGYTVGYTSHTRRVLRWVPLIHPWVLRWVPLIHPWVSVGCTPLTPVGIGRVYTSHTRGS